MWDWISRSLSLSCCISFLSLSLLLHFIFLLFIVRSSRLIRFNYGSTGTPLIYDSWFELLGGLPPPKNVGRPGLPVSIVGANVTVVAVTGQTRGVWLAIGQRGRVSRTQRVRSATVRTRCYFCLFVTTDANCVTVTFASKTRQWSPFYYNY